MTVQRIAAFSDGPVGGNPAGVLIASALPAVVSMQAIAREVGFSETAFAAPLGEGWRVRYFSPASEVPFCGHATIALGAALAGQHGDQSAPADPDLVDAALRLFALAPADLDPRIPPAAIHAGADHLVLALPDRGRLARMAYDLEAGRALMQAAGLVTIALVHGRDAQHFEVRNAFASGGVLEDPATGAAAAAFAGYLRDLGWPHGGAIEIVQGEDMGMRSRIEATIPRTPGSSIRVAGTARLMP